MAFNSSSYAVVSGASHVLSSALRPMHTLRILCVFTGEPGGLVDDSRNRLSTGAVIGLSVNAGIGLASTSAGVGVELDDADPGT